MEQHHICEANASYRIAIHHFTNNRFYGMISVIGAVVMKENKLVELSMDFSVDIALSSKCTSLRVMLIASCKTAKENAK